MQQYTFDWPNGQICNLRQFPYNSKKQCNNRLYGALASATPIAGIAPSTLPEGTLLRLGENGKGVNFILLKHDYQSDLNGEGLNLCIRKDLYDERIWGSNNEYAKSEIDSWLSNGYYNLLEDIIKQNVKNTSIYYTPGGNNFSVSTLERKIFILSYTEVGFSGNKWANIEGEKINYFLSDSVRIAKINGVAKNWHLRSPETYSGGGHFGCTLTGDSLSYWPPSDILGSRPAFCIPNDLLFNSEPNSDGSYSPVGSPYAD